MLKTTMIITILMGIIFSTRSVVDLSAKGVLLLSELQKQRTINIAELGLVPKTPIRISSAID